MWLVRFSLAYIGDAMWSSVERMVRLGAPEAGPGQGVRAGQAEKWHIDGTVYLYFVGVSKWQKVCGLVHLVFGHVVTQPRYWSSVEPICLAVVLWVVLSDSDDIHPETFTHCHEEFSHELRTVFGVERRRITVICDPVFKEDARY